MKVICIFDYITSPISTATGKIEYGVSYIVKSERYGYSDFAERFVDSYELEGIDGLFEKGIFIPVEDNEYNSVLKRLISVPKKNKKWNTSASKKSVNMKKEI